MNKAIKIIGWILLGFTVLITGAAFLHTLILSVKDYTPMRGLMGSAYVGLKNFGELFSSPYLARIFKNTAVLSVLGGILGALYVFLGICAAASFKNKAVKALFAVIFTIPAIIPQSLFTVMLPTQILIKPSFLLQVFAAAADGLRLAALFIPAAVFISENITVKALKCALMFVGIKLICFLTVDTTYLYNPATYEVLDTFSNFVYRKGFMESSFSYSAAIYVLKVIFQLVPAIVGCVILISAEKISSHRISTQKIYPACAAAVIPAAALALAVISGSAGPENMTGMLMNYYIIGALQAFFSTLFVSGIAFLAANGAEAAGKAGIALAAFLLVLSDNITGSYLVIRQAGFINSHIGVILENLKIVPIFTLVFICILKCTDADKNLPALFITGAGTMFARFWGDTFSASVILSDRSKYPISLVMRDILMQESSAPMKLFAALPYILVPVAVVCVALAVGVMLKKKENADNCKNIL